MKEGLTYLVKFDNVTYNDQEYAWIGNSDNLNTWMKKGSLRNGDEIYEVKLIGKIVEKKELELIKTK